MTDINLFFDHDCINILRTTLFSTLLFSLYTKNASNFPDNSRTDLQFFLDTLSHRTFFLSRVLQSNQVKHTPKKNTNQLIILIFNPPVVSRMQ